MGGYTTLQPSNEGWKTIAQRKRGVVRVKLVYHRRNGKHTFERYFCLHEILVGRGSSKRASWKPIPSIWID